MRDNCHIRGSERGTALISILLLLIIMSALSAGLTISTRTEVMVAKNRQSAAQARAAAEAGLNHAAEVVIANLLQWKTNGFATPSAAITRLLKGPDNQTGNAARDADNGSLENLGIPRPPARLGLNNFPGVGYEARVFDEDDPDRGLTLTAADRLSIGENGDATTDANTRVLIRAIGYANDGTQLTLEATVTPAGLPAILAKDELEIEGSVSVLGNQGGVHSNNELELKGNVTIARDATASGSYEAEGSVTVGGTAGGGRPSMAVPQVRAIDYRPQADYILTSAGRITNQAGTVLCDASADNNACRPIWGWRHDGGAWTLDQNTAIGGTYFAEQKVEITGNVGSVASPLPLTIIAQGEIKVEASANVRPAAANLMFVADEKLEIKGNFKMAAGVEGQILARDEIKIEGNPTIFGNIVSEDEVEIKGNAAITYNGLAGGQSFIIGAWREVR